MKAPFDSLFAMFVCSGVLYALYVVLLDRRVPFGWCRRYLLAATVTAAVIPLLRIPVWPAPEPTAAPRIAVGALEATRAIVADEPGRSRMPLFWTLYGAGVAVVAGAALRQLHRVRRLRRGAEVVHTAEYTLVRTPQPVDACSWFRTIFVRHDTPEEELPFIVLHELSHIRHRHSAERCLMEALRALLWWNPFVWLLAARLREAEEFEADRDTLHGGCDLQRYMQLILKQLLGYSPDITNGLRNSLTKKRFLMMTTHQAHRYVLLRMAGAVPAVFGLLCAFSFTTRAAVPGAPAAGEGPAAAGRTAGPMAVTVLPAAEPAAAKQAEAPMAVMTLSAATPEAAAPQEPPAGLEIKSDEEPVPRTEQMPTYRGGDLLAFRQWVQLRLRYPQEAQEQQIRGRVVATFVIEKDGRLSSVKVLASPAEVLSDEAVRVLQSAERWEPGRDAEGRAVRVKYTLPIDFQLLSDDEAANPPAETRDAAEGQSEETGVRIDPMVVTTFPKK